MYRFLSATLVVAAALAIALCGCSGHEDDPPTGPNGNNIAIQGPDLLAVTITVSPALQAAANADPGSGAAVALSYITQINAIAGFSSYVNPPSPTSGRRANRRPDGSALAPNDSTTWNSGQLSVTLVTEQADDSVITFAVKLDGTDGLSTFNNFEYISGYYVPDGAEGELGVYQQLNPTMPVTRWSWSRDPLNTLNILYEAPLSNYVVVANEYVSGAGDLSYAFDQNVQYSAAWAPDGSGLWMFYDSSGIVIDSGTWK